MNASRLASRPTATNPRGRQLIIVIIALVVIVGILRILVHHENRYEKLAQNLTVALQNNDVDAVKKYQNAETATTITRGIVGRASDELAPLGHIKSVKEITPSANADGVHEFTVTFDKGSVHERMKVDPEMKIVHFRYEKTASS